MNEFVARKLGEVLAFSRIGQECKERVGAAFDEVLGPDTDFGRQLEDFAHTVEGLADDTTLAKADKTVEKLRGMMEAYIGDEWDNPVEILEWLSFFTGAAAAHWSLIEGAANSLGDQALQTTAADANAAYMGYLEQVNVRLKEHGAHRADAG